MEQLKSLQFKTNIKCGGCISTVTPFLEKVVGIEKWSVDTDHPEKIMTVEAVSDISEAIMTAIQEAGYKIEKQ